MFIEKIREYAIVIFEGILGLIVSIIISSIKPDVSIFLGILWLVFVFDRFTMKYEAIQTTKVYFSKIEELEQIIGFQKKVKNQDLKDLMQLICSINQNYSPFVKEIIKKATFDLSILDSGVTQKIPAVNGFDISVPEIKKLEKGDKLIAVSFLLSDHQKGTISEHWDEYLEEQLKAAERGAIIQRIFITDIPNLKAKSKMPFLEKHFYENFNQTNLEGFFIDRSKLHLLDDNKRRKIGFGFIIINNKIVIKDLYYDKKRNYYNLDSIEPPAIHEVIMTLNEWEIFDMVKIFEYLINNDVLNKVKLSESLIAYKSGNIASTNRKRIEFTNFFKKMRRI